MVKNMIDNIPSIPDGILLMMGPKTLEGGYSPSQKVSSAFMTTRGDCLVVGKATDDEVRMGDEG